MGILQTYSISESKLEAITMNVSRRAGSVLLRRAEKWYQLHSRSDCVNGQIYIALRVYRSIQTIGVNNYSNVVVVRPDDLGVRRPDLWGWEKEIGTQPLLWRPSYEPA